MLPIVTEGEVHGCIPKVSEQLETRLHAITGLDHFCIFQFLCIKYEFLVRCLLGF